MCGPLVVGELDAGAQEGRERHVERQVHAQADHHGRNAEPVHDDAGDKAACEPRHARDARDHGGDHACLRGHKALVGAEGVRTIGGDERDHDGCGDQGAHDAADGLADPLRARVGAQHGAGLKVVHDIARKAARHGYDTGDKEQFDLRELREGCHDEHNDEAKDLHGVDTRLTAALSAHDGGDKGEQRDDDGRDGTEVERDGNDHGDGGGAQADDAGVELKGARDERLLVGVAGAVGGEAADDTCDLRQDVFKDDGDAKAHHKAHTQGLDDALRGHNIEEAGSGTADDNAKVAQQRAGKPKGNRGEAHQKADGQQHGRVVDTKGHAGDIERAQHAGHHAQSVAQYAVDACNGHGAKELFAGLAAGLGGTQGLSCGVAGGELQRGVHDKVTVDERCRQKAQDGAGECHDKHVEPADLVGIAQHPGARDGKRQSAGDHGARGHDGVGNVGLVETGVAHELQEEQRDDGSENDRPGERTHLEGGIGRACRDDHAAKDADDDAAQRELTAHRGAVRGIAHIELLCVYPLPPGAPLRIRRGKSGYQGPPRELARDRAPV